ncbi:hypothetical protein EV183_001628 [Coemansia sp. RSA 2336]|nr:hypothetical protein EV183_001628 [Coemansia sp. RSA 2336]
MSSAPSAITSPSNWPRRRNPIPAEFLYGTPPRRSKHKGLGLTLQADAGSSGDMWSWDSASPSPTALRSCDSTLTVQLKQYKRNTNDLCKQIKLYEDEITLHLQRIDELESELEGSYRREKAGKQLCEQSQQRISMLEEEKEQWIKELDGLKRIHKSELQSIERRHSRKVGDLLAELTASKGAAANLSARVSELVRELAKAKAQENLARVANASLLERLSQATQAESESRATIESKEMLIDELFDCIGELEQRLQLNAQPDVAESDRDIAMERSSMPPANELSLFCEISQAVSAPPAYSSMSAPATDAMKANSVDFDDESPLYWAAVYFHMGWALYIRICVRPILRAMAAVARIALGFVVPEMLLQANLTVVLSNTVCFLCPGMFNALNGLGGAGQLDPRTASDANATLYLAFSIFSLIGGAVVNVAGVRYTTAIACLAYALYTGSYVYYNHTGYGAFTIASGAVLGIAAGILWTAQGVVMISYPSENEKGKFIAIFWTIFNLGGALGGLLPFAINYSQSGKLTDDVYLIFVTLECMGSLVALFLVPPSTVVRDDGSHATVLPSSSLREEAWQILYLFKNRWMLMLLPMSFFSNFAYGYHFSVYNGAIFTLRTRGFNNLLYWTASILSSALLYLLLDYTRWTRRARGLFTIIAVFVTSNIIWACTLVVQLRYTRGGSNTDYPGGLIDFLETSRAAGPITLYFFMGMADSWYQNICYWLIGTLTCDAYTTARYIGFYKSLQSLGAAVSWQLVARGIPFINQLVGNWVLFLFSVPTMVYVIIHIKERALDDQLMFLAPVS